MSQEVLLLNLTTQSMSHKFLFFSGFHNNISRVITAISIDLTSMPCLLV